MRGAKNIKFKILKMWLNDLTSSLNLTNQPLKAFATEDIFYVHFCDLVWI